VDVSRNSRVIYSNVYKTIEKEIRKHEYLYKQAIVDYLCYEEVEKRAKDRVAKTAKRIEKDIGELEGSGKPHAHRKEKRKSRLDTGLSHRVRPTIFRWKARIHFGCPMRKGLPGRTPPLGKQPPLGESRRSPKETPSNAFPVGR
jgi:hypothetical protein